LLGGVGGGDWWWLVVRWSIRWKTNQATLVQPSFRNSNSES
jgi:hypothetical protein